MNRFFDSKGRRHFIVLIISYTLYFILVFREKWR